MNELYAHVTLSPEAVAARFKRFREMAGLSIGQAAMLMQVDRTEIEKTENGHYQDVAPEVVGGLAIKYDVPCGAFFDTGWDERDPVIILDRFARGEISEGAAAYMLDVDQLEVRLMAERQAPMSQDEQAVEAAFSKLETIERSYEKRFGPIRGRQFGLKGMNE